MLALVDTVPTSCVFVCDAFYDTLTKDNPVDTDGGATPTPNNYSMTLGPAELQQSGPELTWSQLRKV